MSKKNKKANNQQIVNVAYQSIFQIVEDETGHASYRRYFDKVLKDLFGLEDVITTFLMSTNQFKYLKKMMNDPDTKGFIQMLITDEDVKTLYDLVRVAYDSMQIYNKPKKNVTSKDIKAYRYLTKLYAQGIKALRKKYKVDDIGKKEYKHKYSELDRSLGNKISNKTPYYNLDYLDDNDEDFGDLYEDDEDDDQFDPSDDFDLSDLPTKFVIGENPRKTHKKSTWILDGDEDDISLYDDSEDDEDEDSDEDVMPQKEFQKYAMSIFEKLLDKLETDDMSKFNINDVSGGLEPNWTPVDPEDIAKANYENLKDLKACDEPNPSDMAPHVYDLSGNLVYFDEIPWLSTYSEIVNAEPNLIFKCRFDERQEPFYKDENGLYHPFNSDTGKVVMDATVNFKCVSTTRHSKYRISRKSDAYCDEPYIVDNDGICRNLCDILIMNDNNEVNKLDNDTVFKQGSNNYWNIYYKDKNGIIHPYNEKDMKFDMESTASFATLPKEEEKKPEKSEPEKPKSYKEMTSEEIINEFNSSNAAQLADPAKGTEASEKIESTAKLEGELKQ